MCDAALFFYVLLVHSLFSCPLFHKINSSDYPITILALYYSHLIQHICWLLFFISILSIQSAYFRLNVSHGSSSAKDKGETIYTKRVTISHWILPLGWPDYFRRRSFLKTTAPKQRTCSKRDDVRLLF